MAPIRTGVTVPYSDEFRDLATNDALLGQLAALRPKGGAPGQVIEAAGAGPPLEQLLAVNTFRHDLLKASSRQDIWHYLVLAACCLLFGDVFIRRVQLNLAWVGPLANRTADWLLGRRPAAAAAAHHGAPPQPQGRGVRAVRSASRGRASRPRRSGPWDWTPWKNRPPRRPPPRPAQPPPAAQKPEEESYTERLLRAKKKVWKEKKDEG